MDITATLALLFMASILGLGLAAFLPGLGLVKYPEARCSGRRTAPERTPRARLRGRDRKPRAGLTVGRTITFQDGFVLLAERVTSLNQRVSMIKQKQVHQDI